MDLQVNERPHTERVFVTGSIMKINDANLPLIGVVLDDRPSVYHTHTHTHNRLTSSLVMVSVITVCTRSATIGGVV